MQADARLLRCAIRVVELGRRTTLSSKAFCILSDEAFGGQLQGQAAYNLLRAYYFVPRNRRIDHQSGSLRRPYITRLHLNAVIPS